MKKLSLSIVSLLTLFVAFSAFAINYTGGQLQTGGVVIDHRAVTITASTTLVAKDSGKTYFIATDALVMTLPANADVTAGTYYKFINSGADANNIITISPAAADGINGVITLAASIVELSGAVDKDLINTKATAGTSDSVIIISNGSHWFVLASTGIWASEA